MDSQDLQDVPDPAQDAANGPSQDTREAFAIALDSFKEKLSDKKRREFALVTRVDLKHSVLQMQERLDRSGKALHMKRLETFLAATRPLAGCLGALANGGQLMAFIWGPMKYILKTAQRIPEALHRILDMYKSIGQTLDIVSRYEKLARKDHYIWSHLQLIYQDILDFHWGALRRFDSPFWHHIWQSLSRSFEEEFQFILANLVRHEARLHAHLTLSEIASIEALRDEQRQVLEANMKKENIRKQALINQWLDLTFDAEQIHREKAACRAKNREAGSWLIEHEYFKGFEAPIGTFCPSPTLWLHGMPGIGKTVLASKIIDHLAHLDRSAVLFFYFEQSDTQRNSFVAAIRNMLGQILRFAFEGRNMVLDMLCEELTCAGSQSTLSSEVKAKKLFQDAVDGMIISEDSAVSGSIDRVFIVLDGLDECPMQKQKTIIRNFLELVEGSCHARSDRVRCIFLSQYDRVSADLLGSSTRIGIQRTHVEADIKSFVSRKCHALKLRYPSLSTHFASKLEDGIVQNAEGMFLYATLMLNLLASKNNARDIVEEMDGSGLPRGLLEAYSRVCRRILHEDEKYSSSAKRLLNLLVVAKRPLKWHEIQGYAAVNLTFDDFDDLSYFEQGATELCGSLVQVRVSGRVEFIHGTTRRCLLELKEINAFYAESLLASKCLRYLILEGFHSDQTKEQIQHCVHKGYYSFMDYATYSWLFHLRALCCSPDADESLEDEHFELEETLDCFIGQYWSHKDTPIKICSEVQDMVNSNNLKIRESIRYAEAFQAQLDQLESMSKEAEVNTRSTLPAAVSRIREVIQAMAPLEPETQEHYGPNLYKCPRINCGRYAEGFRSRTDLEAHQNRHDRPYRCGFAACLWEDIGFASEKERKSHHREKHGLDDYSAGRLSFTDLKDHQRAIHRFERQEEVSAQPDARKLSCPKCDKTFSKKSNLTAHVKQQHDRQESGENQSYECSVESCTKLFTRESDMERHIESQHRGSTFNCKYHVSGLIDVYGGCGKAGFRRQDALTAHVREPIGTNCLVTLLDAQPGSQNPKSMYRCGWQLVRNAWGCQKDFASKGELLAHWKKSFRCIKVLFIRKSADTALVDQLNQSDKMQIPRESGKPLDGSDETHSEHDPVDWNSFVQFPAEPVITSMMSQEGTQIPSKMDVRFFLNEAG